MDERTLASELSAVVGATCLEFRPEGFQAYAVDGHTPRIVVSPGNAEELSRVLRLCNESGAAVSPWGGGTKIGIGNVPRACDVVVKLERFRRVVEHDDANLTATVEAGVRLADLQRALAEHRQFLAIDAPFPERSTIGGIVATNTTGPRRLAYGGVRDLVIGIKAVLPTGEVIKGGGKVVKNVAGYDMCKLFVGSLGTVGIITEVTFKMAPLPEDEKTLVAWGPDMDRAFHFVDLLLESKLLPSAVEVANPQATEVLLTPLGISMPTDSSAVFIEASGFREAVDRHMRDLREMAGQAELPFEVLEEEQQQRLWDAVRNFGYQGTGVSLKVAVPIAAVPEAFALVAQGGYQVLAHAASGFLFVVGEIVDLPSTERFIQQTMDEARRLGGHAVVLSVPPEVKARLDVWGGPPSGFPLMRRLKEQFDPKGILNPGRFVARL